MNKKVLIGVIIGIVVVAAIAGILIFTGGNKGVNLKLDFSHMNDQIYEVNLSTAKDDKVTEFDEEEPNFVRIENETKNYVLDITLDTEAKEAYEQFKTTAKEENELYEETKFGKYDGYYSDDDGIYGYVLLDITDPTFNVFVNFCMYLLDEDVEENNDIKAIYESADIQDILNNIKFKASK